MPLEQAGADVCSADGDELLRRADSVAVLLRLHLQCKVHIAHHSERERRDVQGKPVKGTDNYDSVIAFTVKESRNINDAAQQGYHTMQESGVSTGQSPRTVAME